MARTSQHIYLCCHTTISASSAMFFLFFLYFLNLYTSLRDTHTHPYYTPPAKFLVDCIYKPLHSITFDGLPGVSVLLVGSLLCLHNVWQQQAADKAALKTNCTATSQTQTADGRSKPLAGEHGGEFGSKRLWHFLQEKLKTPKNTSPSEPQCWFATNNCFPARLPF